MEEDREQIRRDTGEEKGKVRGVWGRLGEK